MERRHPNVVNADELDPQEGPTKGAYRSTYRRLGQSAGAQQIGCSLYEVAPGSIAFPYHWHGSNEEALIVVSGTGTLRLGEAEVAVRGGDFIAFPAGPGQAHQLRNTGTEPLRYYALSTQKDPEVVGYPDSKKVAYFTRVGGKPLRALFFEEDGQRDYFDRDPHAG
jgi:uncharacterized cupin superfamily protein